MKTPKEKMMNDPQYAELVTVLEQFIERAQFTPSELREAAVLASINYEMRHIRTHNIPPRINEALEMLDQWAVGDRRQR